MSSEYAWSQVEPATAILCASIVTYRPLFVIIKKHLTVLTGKYMHDKAPEVTEGDWTDMRNSRHTTVRWAVADDFIDREDVGYQQLDTTMAQQVRNHRVADSHEMKPLPRRPEPARNVHHLTLYPGHTVLKLNEDGTFTLDSPV